MKISRAVVVLCGLLTACSSTQTPPAKDVASLSTPGATQQQAPPSDESQRPQLRLDSSDEEQQAAWDGYYVCLKQNGHVMLSARKHSGPAGNDIETPDMNDDSPASKAAEEKCKGKLPLQPPEMDAAKNPKYVDDYHAWVKCINDHGIPVVETDPPGSGWTYNGTVTVPEKEAAEIEKDCQLQAFGGGK
ncbi:hypothetical protein [Actinocrispum sp. NPDC049592]|uniref:hypothetical protein n=1 Tax=Actinocrispum sp. NPDC049592 TaxID=3154835 RepID=UPI003434CB6B